jgi:hypothetical protein
VIRSRLFAGAPKPAPHKCPEASKGFTRELCLGERQVVTKDITKITWQRAGRVTEPGRYMFRFGWLTVTAEDLAIWQQYPEAAFTLVELSDIADDGREQFHLGAFELPLPPMPDEH